MITMYQMKALCKTSEKDLICKQKNTLMSFGIGSNTIITNTLTEQGREEKQHILHQLFLELNFSINHGQKH